tara:strand:+ start:8089 stop:8454 length:366 start_codon:yes stop_codon:yes gene_type:complete
MADYIPLDSDVTAEELKVLLNDLALAAVHCMKEKPTLHNRSLLRRVLQNTMRAVRTPIKDREIMPHGKPNPSEMVRDYVAHGGSWRDLIEAINARGRSGHTDAKYLETQPGEKRCQGAMRH